MMNEVSTIQKIKSIIINIDPQDVLKDAKEYGLEVQTLEDFENSTLKEIKRDFDNDDYDDIDILFPLDEN